MDGDEQRWIEEVIQTNWVSTVGANINAVEELMAEYIGIPHAVALSCVTASSPPRYSSRRREDLRSPESWTWKSRRP